MKGYCMKCKANREMVNPKKMTLKNGRHAFHGKCKSCGTKCFRIGA